VSRAGGRAAGSEQPASGLPFKLASSGRLVDESKTNLDRPTDLSRLARFGRDGYKGEGGVCRVERGRCWGLLWSDNGRRRGRRIEGHREQANLRKRKRNLERENTIKSWYFERECKVFGVFRFKGTRFLNVKDEQESGSGQTVLFCLF
jgi:hypothetical protein